MQAHATRRIRIRAGRGHLFRDLASDGRKSAYRRHERSESTERKQQFAETGQRATLVQSASVIRHGRCIRSVLWAMHLRDSLQSAAVDATARVSPLKRFEGRILPLWTSSVLAGTLYRLSPRV